MGRDLIPTRLHSPCWCSRWLFEAPDCCWFLGKSPHQRFSFIGEVLTEGLIKLFGRDPQKPVPILTDIFRPRGWCCARLQVLETLSFVESWSCQIHETDDIFRVAGSSDDCAAIGMTDQQSGTILRGRQFARAVDIIGQRRKRVLHGEDPKSLFVQERDDMPPV